MSARRRRQAGVTLMELLIAITLVSLLSVGLVEAMRVGISAMEKSNNRFMSNRRVMGAQRVLEDQINNLMLVNAECSPGPQGPRTSVAFFQGDPAAMRFVSSYSLQEGVRGYPRVLEYQVTPGENGAGVRLVVNELPYAGPKLLGSLCVGLARDPVSGEQVGKFAPITVGPQSFVLADKLSACRMLYKEVLANPYRERWVEQWTRQTLPGAVRIEMTPLEPDPARLQLTTVTLPIRVTKKLGLEYVD